jgi:hypothetical protein
MSGVTFNKDDVLTVAQALVDASIEEAYGDSFYGITCLHCFSELRNGTRDEADKLEHEPRCAVLVARDLLVGEELKS